MSWIVGTSPGAHSASLAIPDVAHEALPAAGLLRELVFHFLRFAVALDRFAHLLVDLPQCQAAGAFELVWVVFRHGIKGFASTPMLNSKSVSGEDSMSGNSFGLL